MMNKINWLIVVLFVALSSCEKVINIDLNSSDPKLIVEANLTNLDGPYTVLLSNSVNYYDPNIFPAVTGATVTIFDNAGNSELLTEVSAGRYQSDTLQGMEGRTYSLKIVTNGKEYHATSTMPDQVAIDSLNLESNSSGEVNRVICKFKDPEGIFNYYRLQLNSNDISAFDSTRIRIVKDGFADGQELSLTYRVHLLAGDTVTAKLECIDKSAYDFYRTIPDVEGGLRSFMSAPPANPLSNIDNNAIGYFNAYAVTLKTIIVQ